MVKPNTAIRHFQHIWGIQRNCNWKVHQKIFMRRVRKWAKRKGVKPLINKGEKIQKQNIEAIAKLHSNSGDGMSTLKSAGKGYTPIMCLPWTSAQLEELAKKTTARERAEGNNTEGDIWDEENEGPRDHTRNFHELRSMIFAHMGCSYASFTKHNDQYQKLSKLCTILQNVEVEKAQGAIDSPFCTQFSWAVLIDCRDIYDDCVISGVADLCSETLCSKASLMLCVTNNQ